MNIGLVKVLRITEWYLRDLIVVYQFFTVGLIWMIWFQKKLPIVVMILPWKPLISYISSINSNCSISQTCENVRFTTKYKEAETWVKNKTLMYVTFQNPEVEYQHTYISYDLQSLIGEIGGILGITLGASALTLFEFFLHRFPYY